MFVAVSPIARAHISPARLAHINQHGRYRFTRRGPADGRLRRLRPANIDRQAGGAAAATAGTVLRSDDSDGD